MRSRSRIVALLAALTAALAVASPAMAKGGTGGGGTGGGGGGGGGGGACAKFSSYSVAPGVLDATRASLTVDYSVAYSCIDESWPPISFTIKNASTGESSTAVYFGPILPGVHEQVFAAAFGTKYTVTTRLTQPSNGAIWDSRTDTITTPAAPAA